MQRQQHGDSRRNMGGGCSVGALLVIVKSNMFFSAALVDRMKLISG